MLWMERFSLKFLWFHSLVVILVYPWKYALIPKIPHWRFLVNRSFDCFIDDEHLSQSSIFTSYKNIGEIRHTKPKLLIHLKGGKILPSGSPYRRGWGDGSGAGRDPFSCYHPHFIIPSFPLPILSCQSCPQFS